MSTEVLIEKIKLLSPEKMAMIENLIEEIEATIYTHISQYSINTFW